ncbi:hypothetical protein C6Q05_11720 [Burkholderia multivorans]|uniref:Uncharacterized protein n=1 Tax=Burkholderia multivorans TaxID=87883 RepID=A0AB37AVZ1_9BURK|nr:hypothetical protein C6P91_23015 [Burkholderia multivorans]PRE49401.1 hypothetical protein C6P97_13360 [Burkholderia multivorans]PRE51575.1 hypothetical protein C6P99_09120 [Burkholderia multivorans]PRF01039.1 hypothetical protein C6Q05_11720 [Burkholderia multivorans]
MPEKGKPRARLRAADVRPSVLRPSGSRRARRAAEAASVHLPVQNSMVQKCEGRESDCAESGNERHLKACVGVRAAMSGEPLSLMRRPARTIAMRMPARRPADAF